MKKLIDAGILFTLVLVITVFLAALHLAQASEISSKNMDDVIASGWWVNHSEGIEVTEEGVTVTFHSDSLNYSNANYTWDAPSYVLYTADESFAGGSGISNISGYSEYFFLRSDLYGWDKSGNTTGIGLTDAVWTVVSEPDDWEAWQDSVAAGIDCTLEAWLSDSAVVITLEVGDAVSTAVVPVDDVIPYISISGELCDLTEIVVTSTAVSRDTNVGEIVIASGECGDDLIWELYDDWKIVISGTGDMYDYISSTLPWWPLCSQIRYAVFEDGVTSIGDSAFYEHTNLCSVELSDSITSIGEYAFCDCGITSIDIPENVTEIGYRAFFGSELVKVEIPDSVTTLGETAFCYCDALAEVVIGNGVTSIATGTFESCESLTKVVIPDSVKSIGSYAFAWCSGLTDVTIGSGVTSIGAAAFYECSNLVSVNIPDNVYRISDEAFSKCTSLTTVEVGDSVTVIGSRAFYQCESLTDINIPDSVTEIGSRAFWYCTALTEIVIGKGITSIGEGAFAQCSELTSVTIWGELTSVESQVFYNCYALASVNIPDSVTSIGSYAFYGCHCLKILDIPAGVTEIGESAFYGCSGIEEMHIPAGVTVIEANTFNNCQSLKILTLPSGITSIGDNAFYDCHSLETLTLMKGLTSIGESAFSLCSALKELSMPSGVTSIGESAFSHCSALIEIEIPSTVTSIGEYAFYACASLEAIIFEGNAPTFASSMFSTAITAYYPEGNETWTEDVMQDYGGTITWISYVPSDPYTITDTLSDDVSEAVDALSTGVRAVQQIVFNEDCEGELTLSADEEAAGENGDKVLFLQFASDGDTDSELVLIDSSMIDENGEIIFLITDSTDGVLIYGINGDVTGDQAVDASDTLAILRGVSGRTSLDEVEKGFADVNLDGEVNSNDLLAVVKFVSGRTSSLN